MTPYQVMFLFGLIPFVGFAVLFVFGELDDNKSIIVCVLSGIWCLIYVAALQILSNMNVT